MENSMEKVGKEDNKWEQESSIYNNFIKFG